MFEQLLVAMISLDPELHQDHSSSSGRQVYFLEVKYTEMQPQIIKDIIPPPGLQEFIAVSKNTFFTEDKMVLISFEYWFDTD